MRILLILIMLLFAGCKTFAGFAIHSNKFDGDNLSEGALLFKVRIENRLNDKWTSSYTHDSVWLKDDSGSGLNEIDIMREF